ncbi:hypothetical protein EG19_08605 [Thermoanaerobaculum aquaticum]|uniref:Anthranilate phosphoribosyltransferase n=1 Tax=Thermoanaerobaculum aquaticum TaxID=1312852 RepID=A0A062XQA7_9BACT|nr:anthranilate phosphoribosyltransferase [Thermoanaerobaculum aquaticum]KDA52958.1 hypothetical protein EG19_08605 [Thermoanaerobaculum aquaticum]
MFKVAMETLLSGRELAPELMRQAFSALMGGELTPAQQAAFLVALRAKGETASEVAEAARVMREFAVRLSAPTGAVDTCGTGGDGAGTLNISTAAAILTASLGVPVAKHGNRSVSSRCGSADVLEAMGWPLTLAPEALERLLQEEGFAFLFAPAFHPAMKVVAPVRRELGLRTVFNLLGPLANPAGVQRQVVGVFSLPAQDLVAEALARLGAEHVWVVHSEDGMDELSPSVPTRVVEVREGAVVREFLLDPQTLGVPPVGREDLLGGEAVQNAQRLLAMLGGEADPAAPAVALASAAALVVAGRAATVAEGYELASSALKHGTALGFWQKLLSKARELSHG